MTHHHFNPDRDTLLEGIPSPTMILDNKIRIVAMNRMMEKMSGHTLEDVKGVNGELVIRSNVGNTRGQQFVKVLQSGNHKRLEGDILDAGRKRVRVQCHISPLQSEDGKERGLLVIVVEIPDMNKAEGGRPKKFGGNLIGHSPKMQVVFDMAQHMALTDASILITGETGTGKDRIAEIIHQNSSRSKFPFIKINCGALPEGLLESELFGHVKGAFTGASRNKSGMFKLADKGTLFLTEIGDMPLQLQVKLLSVLDDRRFVPVGAEQSIEVDVRIIAATHRPLRQQVRQGEFREDLFYRLNVLQLHLPPLRERAEDIRALLGHFMERSSTKLSKSIKGFRKEAMDILLEYNYPGNIREMTNIMEYAVHMCRDEKISREHLPPYMFEKQDEPAFTDKPKAQETVHPPPEALPVISVLDTGVHPQPKTDMREALRESWEDIERQLIVDALVEHSGSRSQVAEKLEWNRMKLWRRMKKYGLL